MSKRTSDHLDEVHRQRDFVNFAKRAGFIAGGGSIAEEEARLAKMETQLDDMVREEMGF